MADPIPGTPLPYPLTPQVGVAPQAGLQLALDSTLNLVRELLVQVLARTPPLSPDGRVPVQSGDTGGGDPITGFATEAKQDTAQAVLDVLSREATQQAIGTLLSRLVSANHADLTAVLTQLGQTLTVNTGLTIPQPQTDALTNAQLRALAVAISAASLPLPAGAATEAKQLPDNHQVAVSNADFPLPAAQVLALAPQTDALTLAELLQQDVPVRTEDSSEREYTPGLLGALVTDIDDTVVYTPPAGKAWVLHAAYAVPVTRGSEDPPVITIKTISSLASGGTLLKTHFVWAANSSRKRITMPADARLVVNLDLSATRVATTFDIEELP